MSKPWRPKKISVKNGAGDACAIWRIEFKTEGETTYARLTNGMINNITPANLNEWVTLTAPTGFLLITLESDGSSIASYSLTFQTDPPNPVGDDAGIPPASFSFVLARVESGQAISRFKKALSVLPYLTRTVGVAPTEPAEDNNIRYYTWQINEI